MERDVVEEVLRVWTTFRGKNAGGAKADAVAMKKEAAATENFMVRWECVLTSAAGIFPQHLKVNR
jgi:hypothetical protein